jgi:hypothetical protein
MVKGPTLTLSVAWKIAANTGEMPLEEDLRSRNDAALYRKQVRKRHPD